MTTGIAKELEKLKQVQVLDKELHDLREAVSRIPALIREREAAFASQRAGLERAQETLKQLQLKQKGLEMELGGKEEGVKKHNGQLAQVKTNQEYKALQTEIANLKADASLVEDQILKLMEGVEAAKSGVQKEKEALAVEEKTLAAEKQQLLQERQTKEKRIAELAGERKTHLSEVDRDTAKTYDGIVRTRSGIALALIDGESCGACQMLLRPQIINEVQLGERLIFCESCARILYIEGS